MSRSPRLTPIEHDVARAEFAPSEAPFTHDEGLHRLNLLNFRRSPLCQFSASAGAPRRAKKACASLASMVTQVTTISTEKNPPTSTCFGR